MAKTPPDASHRAARTLAKNLLPLCPVCDTPMRERQGPRGPFWGCSKFPACRGTRQMDGTPTLPLRQPPAGTAGSRSGRSTFGVKVYDPIPLLPGSDEQEAIWKAMLTRKSHLVLNCGPGTGKTFVAIQGCLRFPKTLKVLVVAFNKHIAVEASGKLAASGCFNAKGSTFHSVGLGMLRGRYPSLGDPDDDKMKVILERLSPEPPFNKADWRRSLNLAEKLCAFAKNYLLDFEGRGFEDELERLADHHNLDATPTVLSAALQLVRPALIECLRLAGTTVNFDDMLWIPVVQKLSPAEHYDVVMVDESQDLSPVQHEMSLQIARSERLVIIGDVRQSIYGWRGASTQSIADLTAKLKATTRPVDAFPLTITRRCPKANVAMARALFPNCAVCDQPENAPVHQCGLGKVHKFVPTIQALPDAPMGDIKVVPEYSAIDMMRPGDLVLCRVNARLVSAAYALLRRGIKAVIRGRNIGDGLITLIGTVEKRILKEKGLDKATGFVEPPPMAEFVAALRGYQFEETAKLIPLGDKGAGRREALREKCECMFQLISEAKTVPELKSNIERLFADFDADGKPNNAVVLGTIHRTKGLEATRVFILAPELIPHPMARADWEREQERNCAWIAITRTKFDKAANEPGTTVFCGAIPTIYADGLDTADRLDEIGGEFGDLGGEMSDDLEELAEELDRQEIEHDPAAGQPEPSRDAFDEEAGGPSSDGDDDEPPF